MGESTIKTSDDAAEATDKTPEVGKDAAERHEWESPVLTKLPAMEARKPGARFDGGGYS